MSGLRSAALCLALVACAAETSVATPSPPPTTPPPKVDPTPPEDGGDGGSKPTNPPAASDEGRKLSVHTTLGIPEAAKVDDPERALLVKDEYVTSFDSKRKNPRWASWEVTTAWIGSAERSTTFRRDPDLPSTFAQATSSDYTNSGFHQGHIVPSADRTKSDAVNEATFVFTNVVPQTSESNLGPWKSLETQERALAAQGKHVFVIAGMLYETERSIGDAVAVPSSMFKVVVALDKADPTAVDVTPATQLVAVDIPNTSEVSGSFKNYKTTIADLEKRSGFHLLSDVAPATHDKLAAAVNDL